MEAIVMCILVSVPALLIAWLASREEFRNRQRHVKKLIEYMRYCKKHPEEYNKAGYDDFMNR